MAHAEHTALWLQMPPLPAALSLPFRRLLASIVLNSVDARPSAREAWRRLCCLCFVPHELITSPATDGAGAGRWLLEQRLVLAVLGTRARHEDEVGTDC